jgi:hypothetical protein
VSSSGNIAWRFFFSNRKAVLRTFPQPSPFKREDNWVE